MHCHCERSEAIYRILNRLAEVIEIALSLTLLAMTRMSISCGVVQIKIWGVRMKDWIELVKAIIRPFIIVWGFLVYGVCIMTEVEVPALLAGLITAVVIEYFGERAIKKFREK